MKYYIIAGEASGDLHASNLMKELKKLDADAHFRCWGGDRMSEQGGVLVKHYRDLAFMGFIEVLINIRTILRNMNFCKKDILQYKPHALILVDYPGFNLEIAQFAHKNNLRVYYYISPQVWAWKSSRVKLIKKVVHKMFVILPFEKEFYARFNYEVLFVGHPLLDAVNRNEICLDKMAFIRKYTLLDKRIVALLPGSRLQEIKKILPVMLKSMALYSEYQLIVCAVGTIDIEIYKNLCRNYNVKIVVNDTYNVLNNAHAALVTSGTATLETALFGVAQVVCYYANYFSYIIAKNLIKLKYISLVNLILDKNVLAELIQKDLNTERIRKEFEKISEDTTQRKALLDDYNELKEKLGGKGASERTATYIFKEMSERLHEI